MNLKFGKMKIERNLLIIIILNGILSASILIVNWYVLRDVAQLYMTINIIAIFVFIIPIVIVQYNKYSKKKQLEENFPVFLRDFVESLRGGLTVPQAFKSVSKNSYGSLNPYIDKIAAQLEWGITVERALLSFSKQVKSKVIGRIISSVVESHRYGGNLADTFEALSNTAVEVDRLRDERRLYLQSQMITGYIIFFVFLAVILGLERFLVPSLTQNIPLGVVSAIPPEVLAEEYKGIFRNLILMQGFFAGLSVGKMAEGAIIAGIKHSMFMMVVGIIVFLIFG